MRHLSSKKAILVGATALAIVALSAAVALAAPVLQPGTTSAPGMSGTCTDCHTYAKPATAAPKPLPQVVSHPYIAKTKQKINHAFAVWGYFPPSMAGTTDDTLTVTVQRYAHKKWTGVASLTTTATISASGKFKNENNYALKLKVTRAGSYRMRATLAFVSNGVATRKSGSWKKFSVRK
jgi:hypothetical protein